jgi:hypothetical protein
LRKRERKEKGTERDKGMKEGAKEIRGRKKRECDS